MVEWHCCQRGKYYEPQMNKEKLQLDHDKRAWQYRSTRVIIRRTASTIYCLVSDFFLLNIFFLDSLPFKKASIRPRDNFSLYFSSRTSIINGMNTAGRIMEINNTNCTLSSQGHFPFRPIFRTTFLIGCQEKARRSLSLCSRRESNCTRIARVFHKQNEFNVEIN